MHRKGKMQRYETSVEEGKHSGNTELQQLVNKIY